MIPSTMGGKIGLWTHVTERVSGRLHDIKNAGFGYLVVKVEDGDNAYHAAAVKQLIHDRDAAKLDLPFVYWGFVYPNDPVGNAKAIAAALPTDATDFIVDAEKQFEDAKASLGSAGVITRVHTFCQTLRKLRPTVRLHLSSFWSTKFHADFPFRAFLLYCETGTWMPQAYFEGGGRSAENILAGTLSEGKALVAGTKVAMLPTINHPAFLPLLKHAGVKEFNVYAWDPEGDAQVVNHLAAWSDAIKAFRSAP